MKKVWFCALIVFCLAVYHSHAQIKWDAEKFMPLSDVKPGMQGKGLHGIFWDNGRRI